MLAMNDTDRAHDALHSIPADLPRDDWHKVGRAAIAAGLDVDTLIEWSRNAANFKSEQDVRAAFRTVTPDGGTGAGTLFKIAAGHGWRMGGDKPQRKPIQATTRRVEPPRKPAAGMSAGEVWSRCEAATNLHPYVVKKEAQGVPLDTLRVLPDNDPLVIGGVGMGGALVIAAHAPDGTLQSAQLIPREGKKMNLPGSPMAGASFTVGEIKPGEPVYIVEGVGQGWSVWQSTGCAAVVAFGWGNVARVAGDLRARDASARLVLVPDTGKEKDAADVARELGCAVAEMPPGEANNFDANDLKQRDGGDALAALLESAQQPAKPEPPAPRYKLLTAADLRDLPPLAWRVKGVLPAVGLAALYGPSASGKSFLAFDMAASIAEGQSWFDSRIEAAPVVYAALEGEAGFKLRAQAWETSRGRSLPAGLLMMMQPFKLTEPQDVQDFAAVVPAGAVVFLDTLNRAAPTADENSSKDMGEILQAAKTLQAITGGLVVVVHHTGKNAAAGLRGHSSLFAAMDAAVEVSRDGDRREWKVAKSKDGKDGEAYPFKLQIETLGVDEYGDPITSCVVMADNYSDDVKRVKLPQGGNQRLVYEGIRNLFKDGISGKPGAPPFRPCIELEAAVTAGAARLTCENWRRTTRTRDAITGLVSRGVLGLNEGWLWLT